MADFKIAFQKTLGNEGGWNNVPGDHGGETYKGVTRNHYPNWPGWKIIDKYKPLRNEQIIKSTELDAYVMDFYKKLYWDVVGGDQIEEQEVADTLFDFGVTSGTSRSIINIQKDLNLATTGKVNGKLLDAINNPEKYLV